MATAHVFVGYTIEDAKGAQSSTEIKFPANADIAIVSTFARSTAQLIDAIIRGKFVDISVGLKIALSSVTSPSLKSAAIDTADVEEGARFQFNAANGGVTGFRLPTFDEDFLIAGSRLVDTADASVDAVVQRIIQGQTVGLINVSPSDQYGSDVTTLKSAKESFTNSR